MTKAVRELKLSSFSVPTGDVGCFWRPAGIVLPRSCVELILYIARARVIYRSAGALRFIVAARVIARVMNHICATSFSPTPGLAASPRLASSHAARGFLPSCLSRDTGHFEWGCARSAYSTSGSALISDFFF
jgi:hypothetical protein